MNYCLASFEYMINMITYCAAPKPGMGHGVSCKLPLFGWIAYFLLLYLSAHGSLLRYCCMVLVRGHPLIRGPKNLACNRSLTILPTVLHSVWANHSVLLDLMNCTLDRDFLAQDWF